MNPSREGMRICIELRRDANPNVVLNQLYKHTQLQDTFGVIMLALVNNEPKVTEPARNADVLLWSTRKMLSPEERNTI